MDYCLSEYSKKIWDRLEDVPRLIVIKLSVTREDKIACHIYACNAHDNYKLSLLRLIVCEFYIQDSNQHAFLFESHISPISYRIAVPDVIIGFIPHPSAKKTVRTKITIILRQTGVFNRIKRLLGFNRQKCFEWTCFVQPSHILPLTPFVYGIHPFPNVAFMFCNVKIECEDEYVPTLLCANLANNYRINVFRSNILLPDGEKLCSLQHNWDNDTVLPDIQALIIEEQKSVWAKERHDLIFKELMEKTWSPRRVTLEMLDT